MWRVRRPRSETRALLQAAGGVLAADLARYEASVVLDRITGDLGAGARMAPRPVVPVSEPR